MGRGARGSAGGAQGCLHAVVCGLCNGRCYAQEGCMTPSDRDPPPKATQLVFQSKHRQPLFPSCLMNAHSFYHFCFEHGKDTYSICANLTAQGHRIINIIISQQKGYCRS